MDEARTPNVTTDEYFGGCPCCGKTDGYFNLRRNHFFVCHEHRVKWIVGENLFSSWRQETPDDWERNAKRFSEYADVEPVQAPMERWQPTADDPLPTVVVTHVDPPNRGKQGATEVKSRNA